MFGFLNIITRVLGKVCIWISKPIFVCHHSNTRPAGALCRWWWYGGKGARGLIRAIMGWTLSGQTRDALVEFFGSDSWDLGGFQLAVMLCGGQILH